LADREDSPQALMPRINAATAAGRKLGMTVIWSPTDAQENYDGWPSHGP
jgi:hypothetical protein